MPRIWLLNESPFPYVYTAPSDPPVSSLAPRDFPPLGYHLPLEGDRAFGTGKAPDSEQAVVTERLCGYPHFDRECANNDNRLLGTSQKTTVAGATH